MLSVTVVDSQHQGEAVHQAENHAATQTGNENAQQVQQQRAAAPNGDISQTDNNHEAHTQPQGTPLDDSHPEQKPQPGNNSEEQSQRVALGAFEPDGNNTSHPQELGATSHTIPQMNNPQQQQLLEYQQNASQAFVQHRLAPGSIQPDWNNTASQPQPNRMVQSTEHLQELGVASGTIHQINNPTLQLQLLTDKLQQQRLASGASLAVGGDAHSSDSSRMNTAGVQEGQPPYTNKALIAFYQQLASHISTDYMKVGKWLRLTNYELTNIDGKRSPEDKVYEMFMKWREIKGREATPQVLAEALQQSGKCNLAEDKDLALYKETYTQEGFNDVLNKLSPKIVSIWKKVGTYLGFEDYMLDSIEHDVPIIKTPEVKAHEVLMKWRETKGVQATLELLAEALKKSDKCSLADAVVEFERTGVVKFPN